MARGECWRRTLRVLIFILFVLPQHAAAEPPPLTAFARLPAFRMPAISPDGTRYAALEPVEGRRALVLHRLDNDSAPLVLARSRQDRVDWFAWIGNDRLLYAVSFPGRRGKSETTETRLYSVPATGGRAVSLPSDVGTQQVDNDLISLTAGGPDHILINRHTMGQFSAFRIDVRDGGIERLERGTENTVSWLADQAGLLRIRTDIVGKDKEIYLRANAADPFRLVFRYEIGAEPSVFPLAFDPDDPNRLYIASDKTTGREAIYRYDIARAEFGPPLFSHPTVDIDDILTGPDGKLEGYIFRDDLPRTVYVDPKEAARQAKIDRVLPDTANPIVSVSDDGRRVLVVANGPLDPGTLYLFDEGQAAPRLLDKSFPALARSDLGPMTSFSYKARDGLDIPAYLTRPPGAKGPLPLVVLVHGGPTARDDMSFDMIAQFLASRGYAVLQANFRGSAGYGRAFEERAQGAWGRAMIDDLADGAKALIAKGIADPAHIAIVGTSYGGYAALMGTVRDPALYRCAASISGPTDMDLFAREIAEYRFAAVRGRAIRAAAPDGDYDSISPVKQAAHINVPVLLVHGEEDRVVLVDHTRLMARALRRAGKPYDLVIVDNGDHNYGDDQQRAVLLQSLEKFLAKSL